MKNRLVSSARLYAAVLFILCPFFSHAQVGINNNNPHPSAVLQLTSPGLNQGLLVPQVNLLSNVSDPADGLLVYHNIENTFYYYMGDKWVALLPLNKSSNDFSTNSGDNIIVTDGNLSVNSASGNGNITATGNITASNGTITANTLVGNGTTPIGGIIMWTGTVRPDDSWVLCTGGTVSDADSPINGQAIPDLSGRFVVGYDESIEDYDAIGEIGGTPNVTLTATQSGLPSHDHGVSDPGHSHTYSNYPYSRWQNKRDGNDNRVSENASENIYNTTPPSATGISINPSPANQNATDPHENRPPYYVLAYIMRIK